MENFANALKLVIANQWMDVAQVGYVNTILTGARIAAQVPIVEPNMFLANKHFEKKQKANSVLTARALNQNPDPTYVNQYEQVIEKTFQIGTAVEIDYKILQENPGLMDKMVNDALYDLGFTLDYRFINGDPVTNNNIDITGLKQRCNVADETLINNASATLTINTSATTFQTFVKLLRKAKRKIMSAPGQTLVAWTNETLYDAIIDGRLKNGANALGTAYSDLLKTEALMIENIPIVYTRQDDKGSDILPMTETSSSGSLYLTAIGGEPAEGSTQPNGIFALNKGGVMMTPEVDGNIRRVTIDYQHGVVVPYRSAVRINLLLAA